MIQQSLIDMRALISTSAEAKLRQSWKDLAGHAADRLAAVRRLEARLADVRDASGDPLVRVLIGQDVVQDLSKARSEWCRAVTAQERAELDLDRLAALRWHYEREVEGG